MHASVAFNKTDAGQAGNAFALRIKAPREGLVEDLKILQFTRRTHKLRDKKGLGGIYANEILVLDWKLEKPDPKKPATIFGKPNTWRVDTVHPSSPFADTLGLAGRTKTEFYFADNPKLYKKEEASEEMFEARTFVVQG